MVTNDIYTTEDADFLRRAGRPARRADRGRGDRAAAPTPPSATTSRPTSTPSSVSRRRFADLELVLVETGGDNLTATFSYGLVDRQIFVIDVAGGDKVPRKGGPGVTRSDLLVINKTDLAPLVGADLAVMEADAHRMRGDGPVALVSVREGTGMERSGSGSRDWVMDDRIAA